MCKESFLYSITVSSSSARKLPLFILKDTVLDICYYFLTFVTISNTFGGTSLAIVTVCLKYLWRYIISSVGNLTEVKSCVFKMSPYGEFSSHSELQMPISVATRSQEWTIFSRSNTGFMGSNPTRGMDVCVPLFCVSVVLWVGSSLAMDWSPVQGVLPTVFRSRHSKSDRFTRAVGP
jgi:hypothetical protein